MLIKKSIQTVFFAHAQVRNGRIDSNQIFTSTPWGYVVIVRNSAFRKDGKRMYGKRKYNANLQSDKKSLAFHKLVWCILKWGGQVDYRSRFLVVSLQVT